MGRQEWPGTVLLYGDAINLEAGIIVDRRNLSPREEKDLSEWVDSTRNSCVVEIFEGSL